MNTAGEGGMKKWRGTLEEGGILLGALVWACTEGGVAPGDDAGIRTGAVDAGVGGSGSTAVVPVWTAGAGPKDLPSCTVDSSSDSAAELAAPPAELGLAGDDDGPFTGTVGSIAADRMTIHTPTRIVTFGWRGPSLAPAFAVGDSVRILRKYVGGFGAPRFTTVHSASATAVAFNGSPYTVLDWRPGSTTTLRGLEEGLPVLKYEVGACCQL